MKLSKPMKIALKDIGTDWTNGGRIAATVQTLLALRKRNLIESRINPVANRFEATRQPYNTTSWQWKRVRND